MIPLTRLAEGQVVYDEVSGKALTVLRFERPEPGMSAVMVRVQEHGTAKPSFWMSSTFLSETRERRVR